MRKEEVPQDGRLLEGQQQICYAVDEQGRYVLAPSAGWDPSNVTNIQAWDVIRDQLNEVLAAIRAGEQSPLAFHMARNQMDVALLADYVGLARWRVRRHLKPAVFAALKPALRQRYADLFQISVAELGTVPDAVVLPVPELAAVADSKDCVS
jgi:hypothetical protein